MGGGSVDQTLWSHRFLQNSSIYGKTLSFSEYFFHVLNWSSRAHFHHWLKAVAYITGNWHVILLAFSLGLCVNLVSTLRTSVNLLELLKLFNFVICTYYYKLFVFSNVFYKFAGSIEGDDDILLSDDAKKKKKGVYVVCFSKKSLLITFMIPFQL